MKYGNGIAGSAALAQAREMLKAIPQHQRNQTGARKPTDTSLYGEADQFAEFDKDKLKEAILKEEKRGEKALDDRKRKYNSTNADVDITEEEMEAYRLRKERREDPMSKLGADEIINYN